VIGQQFRHGHGHYRRRKWRILVLVVSFVGHALLFGAHGPLNMVRIRIKTALKLLC
jgi:hypothetical protein